MTQWRPLKAQSCICCYESGGTPLIAVTRAPVAWSSSTVEVCALFACSNQSSEGPNMIRRSAILRFAGSFAVVAVAAVGAISAHRDDGRSGFEPYAPSAARVDQRVVAPPLRIESGSAAAA